MGAGCFKMCTQDLDEHELGEHGLGELRARDWHLGIPSPALRCAGEKAVRARTGKKGATGSRHLACRCLNPVRLPRANSGNLHDQSLASLKRRSTARDRAKPSTALEGLDGVGISAEQRPETSLPSRRPIQNQDSGVRVRLHNEETRDERRPDGGGSCAPSSASKRHLASH